MYLSALQDSCQSVLVEAAGGEYLHKYWTKTGRNSRTATGLILDKYFTRPTNTAGGGGRGVRGVENEQHLGKHTEVRGAGSDSCFLYIFMCSSVLRQIILRDQEAQI